MDEYEDRCGDCERFMRISPFDNSYEGVCGHIWNKMRNTKILMIQPIVKTDDYCTIFEYDNGIRRNFRS